MKKMVHKDTYTLYFYGSDTEKQYPNRDAALMAAEDYVGNSSAAKPFPNENTFLYGPGTGEVTVMVRQDIGFE